MRVLRNMVAVVALAASIAPVTAQATHCVQNVIIFSGVETGQTAPNGSPVRPGPNGSLAGCQVEPTEESLAMIMPGATNMVVAYTGGGETAPEGTLTFEGDSVDLVFTWLSPPYATNGARWESQSIPTSPGAGPVTATVFVDGDEVNTVTYQKYA